MTKYIKTKINRKQPKKNDDRGLIIATVLAVVLFVGFLWIMITAAAAM